VPGFELSGYSAAPVEDVWKLLFDPTRFPEWWTGVETVRRDAEDEYVMWPTGYPDFPMPQRLRTDSGDGRIVVSCQVSDIDVIWQLAVQGAGTRISVRVELPDAEAHREPAQRAAMSDSLRRLAELASSSSTTGF
jgi:uncharacterized protein YndB with AHSA1/START domain